jgi:hypothetical protein
MGAHIIWQASEKLNLKEVGSRIKITKLAHMGQPRNDSIMNRELAKIKYGGVQTRGWTRLAFQYGREEAHSEGVLGRSVYLP